MMSFCSLGRAFTTLSTRATILLNPGYPIPAPDLAKLARGSISTKLDGYRIPSSSM